jgi:hypothetical protein
MVENPAGWPGILLLALVVWLLYRSAIAGRNNS